MMSKHANLVRAQSVSSDQEVNEGLAELELQRLQRQYRLMDGDRKAYSEESRIQIQKQRATIDKLSSENQQLAEELRLLEQRYASSAKKSGSHRERAEDLVEQLETYNRRIRLVLNEVQEIESKIGSYNREIAKQRVELGGVDAAKNGEAISKQIRILENRLDKALIKFNKSLAINRDLRSKIDNLRRERLIFDGIYRKFERELQEQKKQMAEIIEMSNNAYEARDDAQAKIIALRDRAEKEYQAYIQEVKELDRSLEQDRRLKEFMATKIAERQIVASPTSPRADGADANGGLKSKKDRQANSSQEFIAQTLGVYERAFAQIKEVTGATDINELVMKFKQIEDQNFSLFNYVNEINNEIEKMSEEIVGVQRNIDALKLEGVAEEEQRKKVLKQLETQLTDATNRHEQYVRHHEEISDIVGDLQKGFTHLKTILQLSNEPRSRPQSPHAHASSPTPSSPLEGVNILETLSAVEQRSNELLLMNYTLVNTRKVSAALDSENASSQGFVPVVIGGLLGSGPAPPVGNITIQAPNTGDDYDMNDELSDEDDRPLTREELTHKTLKGLSKREKNAVARPGSSTTTKTKRRGVKKNVD